MAQTDDELPLSKTQILSGLIACATVIQVYGSMVDYEVARTGYPMPWTLTPAELALSFGGAISFACVGWAWMYRDKIRALWAGYTDEAEVDDG